MSVEALKLIEQAFKTVIDAAITAAADSDFDDLQVFGYHLSEGDRTLPQVGIVAVNMVDELAPGRGFYEIPVGISSCTHLADDLDRAIVSKLDAIVFAALTESAVGSALEEPLVLMGLKLEGGETISGDPENGENTQIEQHAYVVPVIDTNSLATTTTTQATTTTTTT